MFGSGFAALRSFAALICGCGVSRAVFTRVNLWLKMPMLLAPLRLCVRGEIGPRSESLCALASLRLN
jgi:hypothetical protein